MQVEPKKGAGSLLSTRPGFDLSGVGHGADGAVANLISAFTTGRGFTWASLRADDQAALITPMFTKIGRTY